MVFKQRTAILCVTMAVILLDPAMGLLRPKMPPKMPPKMQDVRSPSHLRNTVPLHPGRHGNGRTSAAATRQSGTPHLNYNGGPIVTGAFDVVLIFYNNDITADNIQANLADFVSNLGSTSWAQVMNQYCDNNGACINGANIAYQSTVVQPDPNAPCANPNGQPCTITDAQIQSFLQNYESQQSQSADLTVHYAVLFDQYVTISSGSDSSCSVFCGYHSAIQGNRGNWFTYSVYAHPAACGGGCGSTSAVLQDLESIMSHEIAETMTDAEVNVNGQLGWYDDTNGEIGDICAWQDDTVTGANGNSYTVQKIWSNAANACVSA